MSSSNVIHNIVSEEGKRGGSKGLKQRSLKYCTRKHFCVGGTACCVIAKNSLEENQPNLLSDLMGRGGSW